MASEVEVTTPVPSGPPAGADPPQTAHGARGLDAFDLLERYGILVVWAVVIVVFSLLRPNTFFTSANFQTIFGTQSVLLVMTLGLLIPLMAGEFDLSVASAMGFGTTIVGWLNVTHHWPIGMAVLGALAFGLAFGSLNAFLVVGIGVPSLVATLGTGTLLGGIGFGISHSVTIGGISQSLVDDAGTHLLGLPIVFYVGVVVCLVVWYLFDYTPVGRYLLFVGESREVSRLVGIRVNGIRAGSLIACTLIATFAGIMQAGVVGAADPGGGAPFLLPAFAGAFLGQTAIKPGRFNPWGTFIAIYFLVTGVTGLELLGYTGWVQDVFYGSSLVIAVVLARLAARRKAAGA